MRGAILWLLGVAAVASLPLSDPPTPNKDDLLQMILNARPEDNDLEGNGVEVLPDPEALSVPVTTQSSVNATSKVPADEVSTPVVTTPEQEQVQQQQVAEEDQEQVTEQEQKPEEVEQVPEQDQAPEQEQLAPEEVALPEQEQVPEEVQQQDAEEPIPEQEQLPVEPQANPLVPVPVQEPSRLEYFIPDTDEEPEIVYIPMFDVPEELPEDGFITEPQDGVEEMDVPEEFPVDIVDVPEDSSEEPMDVFIVPEEVPEGFVPEEVPEGFVPEEVPEGFVPEEVPEGFVPEEVFDGPEEDSEESSEDPDYVPEEAFYAPEEVPEGIPVILEEVSDDPEYVPEEEFDGPEDFPQETYGAPEEVPEVFFDNFGTPEEVFEDRFDGPQEMPEEFSDVQEEVPEGIVVIPVENFDAIEGAPADIFDGPQEAPEAEAGIPEGVFVVSEEFPQEVPEGFYIREELPEGMFVPEEESEADGPQDFPEDAFDGPQEAPEGFFDAPEEAYPEAGPLIPELVPIRVSYIGQEFIETGEPEEDSEDVELQENPQEETFFDPPVVYFVPEGETFVPENADYTPEEEYNFEGNPDMEQDMPLMEEEEYIPEDAPIASDGYFVDEEQPVIEDGAFMPEEEISNDEAMPDNLPMAVFHTSEGDVIVPAFLPDMSDEPSSEEDVPEQFYPQGEESEGEGLAPFLPEADDDEMVFRPFGGFPFFRPAVMMGPETGGEEEQEGDESSGPYVPPNLVEIVVIGTQGGRNDRLPFPFAAQRPFDMQMQPEQLPVRPIAPIAGETFRPDEPLLPIAGEPQTDEEDQLTPIVVDNQTFLIPNENDSQRIIFPEDDEPTQSLPVFPAQWDDEKHFFLPIRSEDVGDDQPLTEEKFPGFEQQQQPTPEFLEQNFRFRPQPLMRRPTFPTREPQDYFDGPQTPQRFGHFHPEPIPFQDDDDDDDIIYPDYDTPAEYDTPFDYFMQSRYPQLYGGNDYYPQAINERPRNPNFTPQNHQLYGPRFGQQNNSPQFYRDYSPFNFRTAMPARSPYRQGYQGPFPGSSGRVAPQSQYETNYGYPWNYDYPSRRPVW